MNKVIIQGRLTKDIETRELSTGTTMTRFSVALDRGKDRDGNDRGADFPSCVAFGNTAINLEKYTEKGCRLLIEGRLQTGSYEKDGVKHFSTDIYCERVQFLDFKGNGSQKANQNRTEAKKAQVPDGFTAFEDDDENIPF